MTDKPKAKNAKPKLAILPINERYRFRLAPGPAGVELWHLDRRRGKEEGGKFVPAERDGQPDWEWVANDRSLERLGLYCVRKGICPDPENVEALVDAVTVDAVDDELARLAGAGDLDGLAESF